MLHRIEEYDFFVTSITGCRAKDRILRDWFFWPDPVCFLWFPPQILFCHTVSDILR